MLNYKYASAVLAAAFLWSTSYAVSKVTLEYFPPSTLAFFRFMISLSLLGILLAVWKIGFSLPGKSFHKQLAISGLLGYTLYFILQNWGIKFAYATDASLLVASYPVITALLERLVYRKPIPVNGWLGIFLAFLGVIFIIQPWSIGITMTTERLAGIGLLLLTGVVWACYNFVINRLGEVNIFKLTYWQTVYGAIFILPLVVWESPALKDIPFTAWLGLIYLAVFCSLVAFVLYNYGLQKVRPNQAVNMLNSVPLFGAAIAYFILGEPFSFLQGLGGVIIIAGVYTSLQANSKELKQDIETGKSI